MAHHGEEVALGAVRQLGGVARLLRLVHRGVELPVRLLQLVRDGACVIVLTRELALRRLDLGRHRIEAVGEAPHLVAAAGGDARAEVAARDRLGRSGELPEGARDAAADEPCRAGAGEREQHAE